MKKNKLSLCAKGTRWLTYGSRKKIQLRAWQRFISKIMRDKPYIPIIAYTGYDE